MVGTGRFSMELELVSGGQSALFVPRRHGETLLGFDSSPPPAARASDPETSRLAEARETKRGRRNRDALAVLSVVRRDAGLTYREIHARIEGLIAEPVTVMKRLSDLEKRGQVTKGDRRRCRISGNPCTTWLPTEERDDG